MFRERPHSHNFLYSLLPSLFYYVIVVVNFFLCLIYKLNFVLETHVQEKHSRCPVRHHLRFQAPTGVW